MCHANPNFDAAMAEMEAAAEQLSLTQQSINTPLFDLLFKLINMPQTSGLAGSKLKVLHTYTHKFMEFYMTECPDGVSIHTVNTNSVHEIADKLRSMGDGLGRLLVYLGLTAENECLMEYVDNLAVAYDALAIAMANADDARDDFCDDCCCDDCCDDECDECGEDAACYKKCGNCDCGMCCGDDDDDDEEDDEDCDCAECSGACKQPESVDKLFEKLFGRTPTEDIPKKAPMKEEADEVADDLATMFAGFLSAMVGDKKGMDAAANAAARLEKRMEHDEAKAKAKEQAAQAKPKAEEKSAQPTEADMLAKVLSDMLGCEVRVKKMPANAPRVGVREVRPGLWNFFEA